MRGDDTSPSNTVHRGLRRARQSTILLTALAISPFLAGCMSGISDMTSLGLTPPSAIAENDAPIDVDSAPEVDISQRVGDGEVAEPEISEEAVRQVADATPETSDGGRGGPLIPLSSGRETVAAYAGGTVSEGGASNTASGNGGSLFQSLFARQKARTPVANAQRSKSRRVVLNREGAPDSAGDSVLPGVDPTSLFEIGQRASADEDAIEDASYDIASLSGGFARLGPNGLKVQRESVRTDCFPRQLVGMINAIERRFGQRVIVTSGYRSPAHNKRVRGAKRSQHMACKAADIIIPNVNSRTVAAFVKQLPGRGGVGTYCHTKAIHIDTGAKREWNWRCRRRG